MNLQAALDAFRAEFINKFPAEKAAIMQRATRANASKSCNPYVARVSNFSCKTKQWLKPLSCKHCKNKVRLPWLRPQPDKSPLLVAFHALHEPVDKLI
jgi:hypothetical protein